MNQPRDEPNCGVNANTDTDKCTGPVEEMDGWLTDWRGGEVKHCNVLSISRHLCIRAGPAPLASDINFTSDGNCDLV